MDICFYRFVMVVRRNALEYIIALVVVKNKVRLKKCLKKISNMTKFYCPNKSINYFFKVDTKLSTSFRKINVNKFLNWYDLNMYIINVIADDETKIGRYEPSSWKLFYKRCNNHNHRYHVFVRKPLCRTIGLSD